MSNPFLYKLIVLFRTVQFSMSTQFQCQSFLLQAIQFTQMVLIHTIQFSISIVFVYTLLDVQTVPFQKI